MAAQLYKHNEYLAGLQELMKQGALGWSSGAVGHLAEIDPETGEVKTWPIAEWSLTPTPAEPRTLGVQELRALANAVPAVRALLPKDGGRDAQASSRPSGDAIASPGKPAEPKSEVAASAARRSAKMTEHVLDMEAVATRTAEIVLSQLEAQGPAGGYRLPAEQGAQPGAAPHFPSLGEFLQAVVRSYRPGAGLDAQMAAYVKALGLNVGAPSEGGYLVEPTYANALLERVYHTGDLLPRCNREYKLDPESTSIKIPYIDETSRADGQRWGGIMSYWAEEAGTVAASKPKIGRQELELKKLFALMYATDELLRNASMLETLVKRVVPLELAFRAEDAVINGPGGGRPLGILHAPCTIVVPKEATQGQDTIVAENVINMWSRLWGQSRKNAVWLISQDIEPQLFALSLTVGDTAIPMYLPANGLAGAPYATLFTRPVIPCEYCSKLGEVGDIILADLGEYALIDKSPIRADSSIHVEFLTDQTAFRWIYYMDGQPTWHAPLTPKNQGPTQSPFVVLEAR
ncbi:MAG: phage major capsid protein [Chloroflexi bacterium]|nr:phage major capsid protein [Chloroflexota bacterium]